MEYNDGPGAERPQDVVPPGSGGVRAAVIVAALCVGFLAWLYVANSGRVNAPVQEPEGFTGSAVPGGPEAAPSTLPEQVQGAVAPPLPEPAPAEELQFQVVDPQEYYDAVDAQKTAPEPEYITCDSGQVIPSAGADGAKVSPCGGTWYGPDPGLTARDAWYDQPKPDKPGTRRDGLRYRFVQRSSPEPWTGAFMHETLGTVEVGRTGEQRKLSPGNYKLPYGTLTIHPEKN